MPPALNRILGVSVLTIMLFGTVLVARADERLDVYPVVTLSEELTDNFPETLINPTISQPVLFPLPPGVTPPPVNSEPYRPLPTTKGTNYDGISTAIGGARFDLTGPSRTLELDYLTAGEFYAQNSSHDRALQDQYVGLRDTERFGETTNLWLGDTFIKGQPIFGQALIGTAATSPLLSQALLQNNFTTNSFSAQLFHSFSPRLNLDLGLHQSYFATSGGSASQSFIQDTTARFYYSLSPLFQIGPSYRFYDLRFSGEPRADDHEPGFSAKWTPDPQWFVSGDIGPLIISSPSRVKYDVGFDLDASYLMKRVSLSLMAGRSPSTSAGISGAGVMEHYGGSASYEIAPRTDVYVNASYMEISGTGLAQRLISYGGGFSRQLNEHTTFFVQYIAFQTNAGTTSRAVTNNVLIGLKLSADPWSWTF